MKIIRRRQVIDVTNYVHEFRWENDPHSGYGIDCDKDGNVPDADKVRLTELMAMQGLKYSGVEEFHHSYTEPALGRCSCGSHVELANFTNHCDGCDRLYNSAGQQLSDPSTWGEETGEHPADILRIP
jgi:hypothetical protein